MVLITLVDDENTQQIGDKHFPRKSEYSYENHKLEEFLCPFTYLVNKSTKFIYGNENHGKEASTSDRCQICDNSNPPNLWHSLTTLKPKDSLLYVQQGEMGVTHPEDRVVQYVGSSDATTCHILIVRCLETGAVGVVHIDSVKHLHLDKFIHKVRTLMNNSGKRAFKENPKQHYSTAAKEEMMQPLEVYIVGGYTDENGTSEKLSLKLLSYFMKSPELFQLKICAIGYLNTISVRKWYKDGATFTFVEPLLCTRHAQDSSHSHNAPILYGAAVDVTSGRVFPAAFTYRGPDETVRHICMTFLGRPNGFQDCYNHETNELTISAFECEFHMENIQYYLDLPDQRFLNMMSTSPKVEPPHFVNGMKKVFRVALENPDFYKHVFPKGKDRIWTFDKENGWAVKNIKMQAGITNVAPKLIDEEDCQMLD